jgi:phospholipid/cholesterol/gamma-HCH transport system substrate-binding protein
VRRALAILVLLGACLAAVLLTGAKSEGKRNYRVDALFYNAANLIPGQEVKIAGAEVGQVEKVKLTKDRRARVQMRIDERFGPFHADAKCRIRPQSLIGEKLVQCDPGSSRAPALKEKDGEAPTVPVNRNEVPVDLDLLFASLRMPYRQRLSLIVNELGTGLAGRPKELNDAIRLANPALARTRRVLEIVDDDRAELGRLIDASDEVIAELAGRRGQVQSFLDRAGEVSEEVASRRGDLALAIDRLPPMLDELQPTATSLASLSREARPVLRDLRAATPGIRALTADFDPLNDAARPALVRLADMSKTGRSAVRAATPVAKLLQPVTQKLPPVVANAAALVESMRTNGVVEGLQGFVYFAALATSRFDRYSHILPSYQIGGLCNQPATKPVAGCDAHFAGSTENPGEGNDKRAARKRRARRHKVTGDRSPVTGHEPPGRSGTGADSGGPPVTSPLSPVTPEAPQAPVPPQAPAQPQAPVDQLLDFLLGP